MQFRMEKIPDGHKMLLDAMRFAAKPSKKRMQYMRRYPLHTGMLVVLLVVAMAIAFFSSMKDVFQIGYILILALSITGILLAFIALRSYYRQIAIAKKRYDMPPDAFFFRLDEKGVCVWGEDSSFTNFCAWSRIVCVLDTPGLMAYFCENGIALCAYKQFLGNQVQAVQQYTAQYMAGKPVVTV